MWQSVLRFISEWFRRPTWPANIVIVFGFLLFLMETFIKVRPERQRRLLRRLGLLAMGMGIVVGVLLYYFG
jgi:hypothetical protein